MEWYKLLVWKGIIIDERIVRLYFPEDMALCFAPTKEELDLFNGRK
jgi:hypothetical protein